MRWFGMMMKNTLPDMMQQRRAARKHLRVKERHRHQHREQRHHHRRLVGIDEHLADGVVGDPAKGERSHRNQDRPPDRHIQHIGVHQIELGPQVIDHRQQGKAAQPGGIAFPFEPGQVVRHRGRRHQELADVIEPPAMNLPFLAMRPHWQVGRLAQPKVQRDEIEAGPDPGDGGDDVQPADREFRPGPENVKVVHGASVSLFCDRLCRRAPFC
jgi:hypothetical protein